MLEVTQRDKEELVALNKQLRKIGTNLNQLTKAANTKRVDLVRAQWEDLNETKAFLKTFRSEVRDALSEIRRRGSGAWKAWRRDA